MLQFQHETNAYQLSSNMYFHDNDFKQELRYNRKANLALLVVGTIVAPRIYKWMLESGMLLFLLFILL